MLSKIKNILFWSVISAAFIGPGTVTVAAKAGASYGLSLLWALTFSVIATIVLQEGAARLTIASGKTLGETIAERFGGKSYLSWVIFLSVGLGCAAYEAGNILGAVSGAAILLDMDKNIWVIIIGLLAYLVLRSGNISIISSTLGFVVAIMGFAFLSAAFSSNVSLSDVFVSAVIPEFPAGSSLLMVGLVGTTVVPYNLFLGSGISKGQSVQEMRVGLIWAVIIGGVISAAVLVVGVDIAGEFSFTALVERLENSMGGWASLLIGIGLLAAGFTSSVTAPLATAIAGQSVFPKSKGWENKGVYFRYTWLAVLATGLLFGISGIKPIPVIILAQAVNGILLPFVACLLWVVLNSRSTMPDGFRNGLASNLLTGVVVMVSIFLGLNNLVRATLSALSISHIENLLLPVFIGAILITFLMGWKVYQERN